MHRERRSLIVGIAGVVVLVLVLFGLADNSREGRPASVAQLPGNHEGASLGSGVRAPGQMRIDAGEAHPLSRETAQREASQRRDQFDVDDALSRYEALMPGAEDGEPHAQYELAMLTRSCAGKSKTAADVEQALTESLVRSREFDTLKEKLEAGMIRCGRLATEVPDLWGASEFWLGRAAQNNDPLALAELALTAEFAMDFERDKYTDEQRAQLVIEALKARPAEALRLATQYVANFHVDSNPPAAQWANAGWWLAECRYTRTCDRGAILEQLTRETLEYEMDEILRLERLIVDSVESGAWSELTLAELGFGSP